MEWADLGRFAFSMAFVLGLIVLLAWLVKRTGLQQRLQQGAQGKRLAVVESLALDPRTRLLLIRRDGGVEHLVMTGGTQPLVIESGIKVEEKKDA